MVKLDIGRDEDRLKLLEGYCKKKKKKKERVNKIILYILYESYVILCVLFHNLPFLIQYALKIFPCFYIAVHYSVSGHLLSLCCVPGTVYIAWKNK